MIGRRDKATKGGFCNESEFVLLAVFDRAIICAGEKVCRAIFIQDDSSALKFLFNHLFKLGQFFFKLGFDVACFELLVNIARCFWWKCAKAIFVCGGLAIWLLKAQWVNVFIANRFSAFVHCEAMRVTVGCFEFACIDKNCSGRSNSALGIKYSLCVMLKRK